MATFFMTRGKVRNTADSTNVQPVMLGRPLNSESKTTSGSNQVLNDVAGTGNNRGQDNNEFYRFTVTGGAVYIVVGESPDASTETGFRWMLLDGQELYLSARNSDKVAVVDVS